MFDLGLVEGGIAETRFAGAVKHFAVAGSTNQMALEAAEKGAPSGVWIADEQTAGRGRSGHGWHSAAGDGLYMSALVRPDLPVEMAARIPLHTGLAVRAAVEEATGLRLDVRWPNDLMFGERKCGGILVESASGAGGKLRHVVVGVGLNVNHAVFPKELAALATSLFLESGQEFRREAIAGAILREVDEELNGIGHFELDMPSLNARMGAASSWVQGKRVRVGADELGEGGYTGWTRGLDGDGFLKVEDDSGRVRTVRSGGVRAAKE